MLLKQIIADMMAQVQKAELKHESALVEIDTAFQDKALADRNASMFGVYFDVDGKRVVGLGGVSSFDPDVIRVFTFRPIAPDPFKQDEVDGNAYLLTFETSLTNDRLTRVDVFDERFLKTAKQFLREITRNTQSSRLRLSASCLSLLVEHTEPLGLTWGQSNMALSPFPWERAAAPYTLNGIGWKVEQEPQMPDIWMLFSGRRCRWLLLQTNAQGDSPTYEVRRSP